MFCIIIQLGGNKMTNNFFVQQKNINDCGVACIAMILKLNGINANYQDIKSKIKLKNEGISAYDIINIAKEYGTTAIGYKNYNIDNIKEPVIAHLLNDNKLQHFVIILEVCKDKVKIADPSSKIMYVSRKWFDKHYTGIIIKFKETNNLSIKNIFKNKRLILSIVLITFILSFLNISYSYTLSYIIKLFQLGKTKIFLVTSLLIFLLLGISKELFNFCKNKLSLKFQLLIDNAVTIPTINKLICLPHSFYQENGAGELISKLNDLSYIKEMISKSIEVAFVNIIFYCSSMLVMGVLFSKFIIINILFTIIYFLIYNLFISKNFYKIYNLQIKNENLNNEIVGSFNNIIVIKNLLKEKFFCNKLTKTYKDMLESYKEICNLSIKNNFLINVLNILVYFSLMVLCLYKQIPINKIIFLLLIENIIIDSLNGVFDMTYLFANFKSSYIRIKEIFNYRQLQITNENININNIEFKNVSFKYDSKQVIDGVTFNIKNKDWILVTGNTGSGKSTLFKLLTKQESANGIYINNTEINDYNEGQIRSSITYVDQKSKLFKDTIRNNILLDGDNLDKASKTALVDQLLKNNNLDYNYLIDNTNSNLSGGQLQKLIIAQTLCNSSNIIIFDETTSQLDVKTERTILKNIKNNYPEKTIILITHRDSNKDMFNKILNFDKGKIINKEREKIWN